MKKIIKIRDRKIPSRLNEKFREFDCALEELKEKLAELKKLRGLINETMRTMRATDSGTQADNEPMPQVR